MIANDWFKLSPCKSLAKLGALELHEFFASFQSPSFSDLNKFLTRKFWKPKTGSLRLFLGRPSKSEFFWGKLDLRKNCQISQKRTKNRPKHKKLFFSVQVCPRSILNAVLRYLFLALSKIKSETNGLIRYFHYIWNKQLKPCVLVSIYFASFISAIFGYNLVALDIQMSQVILGFGFRTFHTFFCFGSFG